MAATLPNVRIVGNVSICRSTWQVSSEKAITRLDNAWPYTPQQQGAVLERMWMCLRDAVALEMLTCSQQITTELQHNETDPPCSTLQEAGVRYLPVGWMHGKPAGPCLSGVALW